MKPLLKWPGGKSRELSTIRAERPPAHTITHYIEPFLGGGAVFFDLQPAQAFLNDINPSLIQFYELVKAQDTTFCDALMRLRFDWLTLTRVAASLGKDYLKLFSTGKPDTETNIRRLIEKHAATWEALQFTTWEIVLPQLVASIFSKLRRTHHLQIKHDISFQPERNRDHLETAVRAAYYTALRDDFLPATPAEESAAFFFIREYCYGSMFRFNRDGKFNIPYGGINYNTKDFTKKIDHLFDTETQQVMSAARFSNTDFDTFFDSLGNVLDDPQTFIFLDPPYDTEFSDYDQIQFGENEQARLAERLRHIHGAKLMVVIKDTPLIRNLYDKRFFKIGAFQKIYTYNVRGRNKREVTHLLIKNY